METTHTEDWIALWMTIALQNQETTPYRLRQVVSLVVDQYLRDKSNVTPAKLNARK